MGTSSSSERPAGGSAPRDLPRVLAYHKVTSFELGGTWVSAPRFIGQMDALLETGFRFIDESAFLAVLDGSRECGSGEVLLTFDDGYRELLDRALPALEARSIPALIFLVSAFVGRDNAWELGLPGRRARHLGWDEVSDLAGRRFSFGSHTRTHRDLTRLPRETVREEIAISKGELEARLGAPVRSLSYPFGRLSGAACAEAERAGYRAAFSLYPPRSAAPRDRFALRREGVYVIDTVASIKGKLGGGFPFWFEDMKGRAINGVAVLTPMLKGALSRASTSSHPRSRDS